MTHHPYYNNTIQVVERYSMSENIIAYIMYVLFLDIGRITAIYRSQIIIM